MVPRKQGPRVSWGSAEVGDWYVRAQVYGHSAIRDGVIKQEQEEGSREGKKCLCPKLHTLLIFRISAVA